MPFAGVSATEKEPAMPDYYLRNEMMTQLPAPYRILHILQRSAGFDMELHSHPFYHVNFITAGTLLVQYQDHQYQVHEGQAVILPPDIPHALSSPEGYCQIGIDILNQPDTRGVFELFRNTYPEGFAIISMVQFPYTFEYLFKAIRNLTKLNTLMLYNASEAFILKLIAESAVGHNDSFREKFLDMFSDGKGYDLTLDQMCKKMNLSKTHLERMVRTEFECGAMEYCQKMKLNKACLLLQNTDLPIHQIAELLKFYDESHFCSFFKRRMQVTPNHYRNETRHIV